MFKLPESKKRNYSGPRRPSKNLRDCRHPGGAWGISNHTRDREVLTELEKVAHRALRTRVNLNPGWRGVYTRHVENINRLVSMLLVGSIDDDDMEN